jgi:NADH-quinone oxidoreductase subunit I
MGVVKVRERVEYSLYERSFVPEILRGLGITLRHFFGNAFGNKETRYLQTVRYPDEQRVYPARFRGQHRLLQREDGSPRCVACYMCSTACPARCIHIEAEESPWADREKYPAKFDIDELRCIYCGMCEEACPVDAIELTHEYDIVGLTRQEMIFDKTKLLEIFDQTVEKEPM